MRKSLFMALIAVLFSASVFSQITWNVKAWLTMNKYSDTKKLYDEGGKMKAGYTFGVGMDYAFTESWSLQLSLMFITKEYLVYVIRQIRRSDNRFSYYYRLYFHFLDLGKRVG